MRLAVARPSAEWTAWLASTQRLRTARRDELPGQPLVWQLALRNLVAQLTGRSEIAAR